MQKFTIDGQTFEVPNEKRLVLAIEESGINIGHRCGGNARCTTCRVRFINGEPEEMTRAEFDKLIERNLFGQYRLSCQIVCNHDMEIEPQMTLESEGWNDTGPPPNNQVTPEAVWFPIDQLKSR